MLIRQINQWYVRDKSDTYTNNNLFFLDLQKLNWKFDFLIEQYIICKQFHFYVNQLTKTYIFLSLIF